MWIEIDRAIYPLGRSKRCVQIIKPQELTGHAGVKVQLLCSQVIPWYVGGKYAGVVLK